MGVEIRRAHPDDRAFLAWVILASARSHLPRGFWDLFLPESEEGRLALAETLLLAERPGWWHWSGFLVAEHEGAPAAALSGLDPAKLVAPNVEVPAAAAARGFDAAGTEAALARCAPFFTCIHEPPPGVWIVESVATSPQARGLGLARALVERVLAEGRERGHRLAQLSLLVGNEPARRVYQRTGFATAAEKRSAAFEAALGCPGIACMRRPL
jgi:GNAT superfamily N-acetyltransferase